MLAFLYLTFTRMLLFKQTIGIPMGASLFMWHRIYTETCEDGSQIILLHVQIYGWLSVLKILY